MKNFMEKPMSMPPLKRIPARRSMTLDASTVFQRCRNFMMLALLFSSPVYAASPAALTLPLSMDAANEAVRVCQAKGFKVAVTIVDPDGVIKLQARDDGSPIHSQAFSFRKAYTVVSMGPMFGLDTGTALVKFLSTYPSGMANVGGGSTELLFVPGGVLIRSGKEVLGAIAVSGSPLSTDDELCAAAGAARIQTALQQ
jgi:uncharacterized protein GlcG (DUF336 family)